MKNLIHTQYFSQLHAFEYEYEYSGLLFQYIVTIMKNMHDSGKKWNGKTTENQLFHYLFTHKRKQISCRCLHFETGWGTLSSGRKIA